MAVPCLWRERSEMLSIRVRISYSKLHKCRSCRVLERKRNCLYVRVCLAASVKVAVREIMCAECGLWVLQTEAF